MMMQTSTTPNCCCRVEDNPDAKQPTEDAAELEDESPVELVPVEDVDWVKEGYPKTNTTWQRDRQLIIYNL